MAEMISSEGALVKTQEVGLALRPTAALLNHSCWPNTVRCSTGHKVVIMASATIHPGEEVTDIYTETFHQLARGHRQAACRSYKFTCSCRACREDWPVMKDLPSALTDQSMLVNDMPMPMVIKLGEELAHADRHAMALFAAGQTWEALAGWQALCELAERRVRQPSRVFIVTRERVQACLWRMFGQVATHL